jgi:hypothetical protein
MALGVILLLNNLGYLPWSVWTMLARFWPVVLILLGLEALLNRHIGAGSVILALLIIGGVLLVSSLTAWSTRPIAPVGSLGPEQSQPLGGASRANVSLQVGAGELQVAPLEGADLARWRVDESDFQRVSRAYDVQNGAGQLELKLGGGRGFLPFGRGQGDRTALAVELNRSVPLALTVQLGAGQLDADLSALQLQRLRVELGAGQASIRMPGAGQTTAEIQAGAAGLTVEIPQGVAARIVSERGLGNLEVDTVRFPSVSENAGRGEYRSPDYDTARDRLDLTLKAGIANVTVR